MDHPEEFNREITVIEIPMKTLGSKKMSKYEKEQSRIKRNETITKQTCIDIQRIFNDNFPTAIYEMTIVDNQVIIHATVENSHKLKQQIEYYVDDTISIE
jgi:hypothetical protein